MKIRKLLPLLLPLLAPGLADAARGDPTDAYEEQQGENERGVFDFDESLVTPWEESATELPPLPADDDLLAVKLDSLPSNLTAHIAAGSLQLNEGDRVLRFWLVITSPAGAYNATYEGLRCASKQYKVYAYGHPRRKPQVSPAPKSAWRSIGNIKPGTYRPEMMRTLMCNESLRPRSVRDILATLRGQAPYRNPSADNYDY